MKVIFSCGFPFYLSHGGCQTLIEELRRTLMEIGVEVEWERWWDEKQTGDLIHVFCRPSIVNVRLAHAKGYKMIMTDLLDAPASRPKSALFAQRWVIKAAKALMPGMLLKVGWEVYQELDGIAFVLKHEQETADYLFDVRAKHVEVINLGTSAKTIAEMAKKQPEEDYLISIATIAPRKNTVMLAKAARETNTPVVFLGKPYSENDPYFKEFKSLVDGKIVRYPGFVSTEEKFQYTRGARGFVLLSQLESGCVAVQEAASAGLPLLLSDLTWARGYPPSDDVHHVKLGSQSGINAAVQKFYAQAHRLPRQTFPVLSWEQTARQYADFYERVLRSP